MQIIFVLLVMIALVFDRISSAIAMGGGSVRFKQKRRLVHGLRKLRKSLRPFNPNLKRSMVGCVPDAPLP